jgi:CheY-like chemotaxis protein
MKPMLIVDDREDDRYLLERALRKLGIKNSILTFPDGQTLTEYLKGPGLYIARRTHPAPTVLFLDLDMPRMNGFETLQWLGNEQRIVDFFVVAVTILRSPEGIKSAYALGARSYLSKPVQEEELRNLIEHYPSYWERESPSPAQSQAG